MSLITKVKAGSVSSLSDARYFAGMGVDWLGFDVNPSSGSFVSVELYKNMAGWVSGPKRVIENHGPVDAATIQRLQADYEPDFIEVDLDQLNKLPSGMKAFARANLANIEMKQLVNYSKQIECLVLQIDGNPFLAFKALQEIASQARVLLNVSPDFKESQKAIRELPITGIALTGSKELKVGVKSYDYSEILELLDDES
jgi:phosphoribosylanthranilate isomerase